MIAAYLRAGMDTLFPPACAACARCGRAPFCRVCAEALVDSAPFEAPGLDAVVARYEYGGPVALAIRQFKYGRRVDLGRPLGFALADVAMPAYDLIVPVPLSPAKLRARGFNQARELALALGGSVDASCVARVEDHGPQVGRPQAERFRNVAGAFAVTHPDRVAERRILVVDDVVTTGATLQCLAATLTKAGASAVYGIALARAAPGMPDA